jgi:CRP/FNR family cyclic AMP-dependent transcriptional regulator
MSRLPPQRHRQTEAPQLSEPGDEGLAAAMVAVLEADPSLGSALEPTTLVAARREALAPAMNLERGRWHWERAPIEPRNSFGILVLKGMLSRRQQIGDLSFVEILGEGDLLRPWTSEESTTLTGRVSWRALTSCQLALLDRDFALRTRHWPEIAAALLERSTLRSQALVTTLAIHGAVRVKDRLLLMLWHLADRWGHVTPRGTVLPVPLTHESLAQLIGARRSPVTVALGELRREDLVRRERGSTWLLSGEPPLQIALTRNKAAG